MRKLFILSFCIFFSALTLNAQKPYKHSVGAIAGTMNGFSYKTFLTDNIALSADLVVKICPTSYKEDEDLAYTMNFYDFELNPNVMYEKNIFKGLYWFAGGGVSMGYNFKWSAMMLFSGYTKYGKFGVNAIGGVEYKFNAPVTVQFDFRPGYGLLFSPYTYKNKKYFEKEHYFDWGIGLSIRYTF